MINAMNKKIAARIHIIIRETGNCIQSHPMRASPIKTISTITVTRHTLEWCFGWALILGGLYFETIEMDVPD